ncbi:cytochrome oxidase subunit III [Achromatium sp. WMS2]|nr:cytochrome oxidase subunit III [Achromatium sp. WMS2]
MSAIPIATTRSITGISNAKLAMWWLLASEIVIFGGLLVVYILRRAMFDHWAIYAEHTNVVAGSINTFALLTSSLFAVLAHQAAETKQSKKASAYLWYAVLFGFMFLIVKSIEWTHEISHGFTINTNLFWSFYFTAAGIHGLHVIAGMIGMAIIATQIKGGHYLHRVEIVGIYWCFVEIVWIFLFPLLYIAK